MLPPGLVGGNGLAVGLRSGVVPCRDGWYSTLPDVAQLDRHGRV